MTRRRKDPLRGLMDDERGSLEQLGRTTSAPAIVVARARALLALAEGCSYTEAAWRVGRRSGDAIRQVVARFNREGLGAVAPCHGGGFRVKYGAAERERILAEVRRTPDREQDKTAIWSLTTLQQALRSAEDGLPEVSTYTIWCVLHEADLSWQRDRSWCHTGLAKRRRKHGEVEVHDPDAVVNRG
ncbi:MAG: helix-turn-helix domain-containing protein [Chloroflexi bacterium]|nr:helix-turn-helix domain-containing protein [Chloroflexota bacterium]